MKKQLPGFAVALILMAVVGVVAGALYWFSEAPTSDHIGPNYGNAAAKFESAANRAKSSDNGKAAAPNGKQPLPPPGPSASKN